MVCIHRVMDHGPPLRATIMKRGALPQGQPLTWRAIDQARPGEVVAAGDAVAHSQALGILQERE